MSKNINRYKFSKNFLEKIKEFCKNKIHLNDDSFNLEYLTWKNNNKLILNEEESYLKSIGYIGNFIQKLDKSVNHYFKKIYRESNICDNSIILKDSKNKDIILNFEKEYIMLDFEFLQLIDNHINRHFIENNKVKPSILYNEFILTYSNEIEEEIKKINLKVENIDKCNFKIKKTYQNRYYNINKKL